MNAFFLIEKVSLLVSDVDGTLLTMAQLLPVLSAINDPVRPAGAKA